MATEKNILIKFTADTGGLQAGTEGLTQMEAKDKALQEQVARTSQEIIKRDKAIADGANLSEKSIEALSAAMNNFSKIQIGAAFTKALADIKSQLQLTDKQLQTFFENAKKGAQMKLVDGISSQEYKTLQTIIQGATNALDVLGKAEDAVSGKSVSLRAQLRAMQQQLTLMEDAGMEGTLAFQQLQIEAGWLSDSIGDAQQRIRALGSDTFAVDALSSALGGVLGGFTALQGAAALFASENEDLSRALLKVNAAMSVLQGIQAVINTLQKQSSASIAIDLLLRRNQAAATTAQAVADTELAGALAAETAATETATVATEGLSTAMKTNPAGILLAVISSLAVGLFALAESSDEAKDATVRLNEAMKDEYDLAKEIYELSKHAYNATVLQKQAEINLLSTSNASRGTILQKELELSKIKEDQAKKDEQYYQQSLLRANVQTDALNEQIKKVNKLYGIHIDLLKGVDKNTSLDELIGKLKTTNDQIQEIKNSSKPSERKNEIDALSVSASLLGEQIGNIKSSQEDLITSTAAVESKNAEIVRYSYEQTVKSAAAAVEARVALAKKGSKEELDAQVQAINARLALETDKRLNPDLTKGEISKIVAEAKRQINELQNAFNVRMLQDVKTGIDARLQMAREGSREELELKIQSLDAGLQAELANNNLTYNQRLDKLAKFHKDALALTTEFDRKQAEQAINSRMIETNNQIADLQLEHTQSNNDQIYRLKQKLIHDQAELEIVAVRASVASEEEKARQIKAIYDRELTDKRQLEQQKAIAEIEAATNRKIKPSQDQIAQNNEELQLMSSSEEKKRQLRLQSAQELLRISRQESIEADRIFAQNKNYEEYEARKKKAAEDGSAARVEIANVEEEKKQAIYNASVQLFQAGVSALTEINNARYQEDLDRNKELYDKKLISEEEYANRVRSIKRQQAEADKGAALFNIFLSTAQAIAKASPNVILIASTAALGAAQTAAVLAKPLPAFKIGKVGIDGPGTTTSDSILARISKGESVINADMTTKHRAALEAINSNKFQDFLDKMTTPLMMRFSTPISLPSVADTSLPHAQNSSFLAKDVVDGLVSKLPAALASKMPRQPGVHMEFDLKTGILTIHNEEQKRMNYTNRKSRR